MGSVLFFVLSVVLVVSGATAIVEKIMKLYLSNDYLVLLGFAVLLGLAEMVITLPLQFYLSPSRAQIQSLQSDLPGLGVGRIERISCQHSCHRSIGACALLLSQSFGSMWWLPVGSVLFILSVVLARLVPVLIFPLFYTFTPLPEGNLKSSVLRLCRSVGMSVEGVYVFDMSKNTKKANAAFAGIGRSKRIILGDTLVANFRDDEIETVFAHELGHYKLRHLWTMLLVGTVSSFLGLYLTARGYELSLPWFGFTRLDQIAALPLSRCGSGCIRCWPARSATLSPGYTKGLLTGMRSR